MSGAVEIFTDGACRGNPGPGGWGALLRYDGAERELSGAAPETTNNRMELMAAIMALQTLKRPLPGAPDHGLQLCQRRHHGMDSRVEAQGLAHGG